MAWRDDAYVRRGSIPVEKGEECHEGVVRR